MKASVYLLCLVTMPVLVTAQNYIVTFAGTGASSTVDSVKVENLSQCTSLMMAGVDTLLLSSEVGMDESPNGNGCPFDVSPNPSAGDFLLVLSIPVSGRVSFALFDLTGKTLLTLEEWLPAGRVQFVLTGIPHGMYILRARVHNSVLAARLISMAPGTGRPEMKRAGLLKEMYSYTGTRSVIAMQFNPGDTLKLTGKSGIYRTVTMLFPTSDQTVIFSFVDCTDIDNNHYAVVQIGTQLWMQENLKTTKYRDGSDIPNVTDSAAWSNLTTGAYCNYRNLPEEGEKYGRLYNWFAVDDSRKICPPGWHVPSTTEWNTLELFLDPTVDTTALGPTGLEIGRILKEGCDTRWQYWDTTYGLNSAGFTALCANFRNASGGWSLAPGDNHDSSFWTATSYSSSMAWFRSLRWCYSDIYCLFPMKGGGNSLRCIKDN